MQIPILIEPIAGMVTWLVAENPCVERRGRFPGGGAGEFEGEAKQKAVQWRGGRST